MKLSVIVAIFLAALPASATPLTIRNAAPAFSK
jgi:hypothetical protein